MIKKIETTILEKCKNAFREKATNGFSQQSKIQCLGIGYKFYEDKWVVNVDDKRTEILKTFASSVSSLRKTDSIYYVDIQDVSVDKLRKYVISLPQKYQIVGEDEFLVPSYKEELTICS